MLRSAQLWERVWLGVGVGGPEGRQLSQRRINAHNRRKLRHVHLVSVRTRTHTYTHPHMQRHKHTHTCKGICIHTHIHRCKGISTHTHTQTPVRWSAEMLCPSLQCDFARCVSQAWPACGAYRRALYTCGTRHTSACVTASPTQYWPAVCASTFSRPALAQATTPPPVRHTDTTLTYTLLHQRHLGGRSHLSQSCRGDLCSRVSWVLADTQGAPLDKRSLSLYLSAYVCYPCACLAHRQNTLSISLCVSRAYAKRSFCVPVYVCHPSACLCTRTLKAGLHP
jgi:hypothetical protein